MTWTLQHHCELHLLLGITPTLCSTVQVKSDDYVLEISSPGGNRLYYLLKYYCSDRFVKSGSNLEKAY
jgi:hypothetical protein